MSELQRRLFGACCLLLSACGAATRGEDARPNVVLIMIDTLRADRLSCYGFPRSSSPELDALAARGVRFEKVVAQSSWTRPSMGSMLTSRYPRSLGIYKEKGHLLADGFWTMAEALQRAGYRTLGATANPHLNRSFNFAQGFDAYQDSTALFPWMQEGQEQPVFQSAEQIFESLWQMIESRPLNAAEPVYLQAAIMEVHESAADTLRPARFRGGFEDQLDPAYLESVRQVSYLVDRFVVRLSERPGWENTLFLITSDHGHGLSDHPTIERQSAETVPIARHHGWLLYEAEVRVPLILHSNSDLIPAGLVIGQQVSLLDLMPTVLDLVGLEHAAMQGRTLAPLWRGEDVAWPAYQISESHFRGTDVRAVYASDWSYYEYLRPIPGVAETELQRNGSLQDGASSNQLALQPAAAKALSAHLRKWESEFLMTPPTWLLEPLPKEQAEQLKAIGYL